MNHRSFSEADKTAIKLFLEKLPIRFHPLPAVRDPWVYGQEQAA